MKIHVHPKVQEDRDPKETQLEWPFPKASSEAGLPPSGSNGERHSGCPGEEWHVALLFITLCVCVTGSRNDLEGNCTTWLEKQ